MLDQWNNYFLMVGGGAAALAGLIFVAMSINPEGIIRNATHKNRAINMLTGFMAVFMACSLALLGRQDLRALGLEWLFLWVIATAIFVRGYVVALVSGMSSVGLSAPRLAGGTLCYIAEVVGAVFLVLGNETGLYIAGVATIVLPSSFQGRGCSSSASTRAKPIEGWEAADYCARRSMASATWSAFSKITMWPASGMETSWLPAILRLNSWA
jgi:hypothetical protein